MFYNRPKEDIVVTTPGEMTNVEPTWYMVASILPFAEGNHQVLRDPTFSLSYCLGHMFRSQQALDFAESKWHDSFYY